MLPRQSTTPHVAPPELVHCAVYRSGYDTHGVGALGGVPSTVPMSPGNLAVGKYDVTGAELQQAKALLLRQMPLAESSETSVAGGLLGRAQIGLPLNEPVKAAQLYYSMTAAQVRAAFAKLVRPDNFVQIVRGPAPQ